MDLIYKLQCTECNAFYTGEAHHSLSDHMNGHWFTTTVSSPDLPVAIHTQSHQIHFQECRSVSVIHKLPDSILDHIHCQFQTPYQLVLQSRHTPALNIHQPSPPPTSTLAPSGTYSFLSVSYSTVDEEQCFCSKVSSLYIYF